MTRFRITTAVLAFLAVLRPSVGAVLYDETFEDDRSGKMPFVGPGRWNSSSQGGSGCLNAVVEAAASPIGSGQAVHLRDPSTTTGNLLLESDDIGTQDLVHVSFQLYEEASASSPFSLVVGGLRGTARFAELQIGAGQVVARLGNGALDVDPAGNEYAQGTVVSVDIVINSTTGAVTYTTSSGLKGSAAGDRYDVYVNRVLVIDDADPVDYSGSIDSFILQTTILAAGVDVYVDNIRVESLSAGPTAPEFSVTAYPPSQTTSLCGTVTYQISVAAEGGFAGYVYLAAAGLPAGATVRFSPAFVTAPGLSVATISVPPTLAQGVYPVAIRATAGGKTRSAPVSLVVTGDAPPQYSLTLNAQAHGTLAANPPAGPYGCGTVVTLTATPDAGYQVKAWTGTDNDSSKANTNAVTIRSDTTVGVEFEPAPCQLTGSVAGGNGTLSPTSGTYAVATRVSLTATPNAGYRVKAWTGTDDDSSTSHLNVVTMSTNKTVTVEFEAVPGGQYQLRADVIDGHGSVSPTDGTYGAGTVVSLVATPDAGYRVKAWTGTDNDSSTEASNVVTMTADKAVTVTFEAIPIPQYTLAVTVEGGNGSVSPTSGTYNSGTAVTLSATPDAGYRVKAWTGTDNDSSTSHLNVVTMTSDKTVTVTFEAVPAGQYQLRASVAGGHGSVTPTDGTYDAGTVVTLTAAPDADYRVKAWTGTDDDASTAVSRTVTMTSDKAVTVVFELIDCNDNDVGDGTDITAGTSEDCDSNGVPDECEADTDQDDTIDACDACLNDPEKTAVGICGCGVPETDSDGDGTPDCVDACPSDASTTQSCAFPADIDGSWSVSVEELTAYSAAWRAGALWSLPPESIPVDYVARAAYLWRAGETYHYAQGFVAPASWQSGAQGP